MADLLPRRRYQPPTYKAAAEALLAQGADPSDLVEALGCSGASAYRYYLRMHPERRRPYIGRPRLDGRPRSQSGDTKSTRKRQMFDLLSTVECVDCGLKDALVIEWDHVGRKTGNIAKLISSGPWPSVLEELTRCQAVCRNCHARRTHVRAGSYRATMAGLTTADLESTFEPTP